MPPLLGLVVTVVAVLVSPPSQSGFGPPVGDRPWLDPSRPLEERVDQLSARMTLGEKVREMYGVAPPALVKSAGYVPGNPRLGIPPIIFSDGPAGVRDRSTVAGRRPGTALPAPVSLAASFDADLARRAGALLGGEARARDVDVLYAPAVNLVRVPQGGRNFEYLGEDPELASRLAVAEVEGIQSRGVAAQVKHYAANNQENGRRTTSSDIDERTLRELYLPPFRAAVTEGRAGSVMCADNPVNGLYSCEDNHLLAEVLDGEWGFDGVVGSDYAATHSAVASVRAGLDQSFDSRQWGRYYGDLAAIVRAGHLDEAVVTEHVRRILRMMFRIGLFDRRPAAPVDATAGQAYARNAAAAGTVLLKNDGPLLPLDPPSLRSVAVVGPYAATAHPGGGGSSRVDAASPVSPVTGLRERLGATVAVTTADGHDVGRAVALARAADVAIVVVGDREREGADRTGIDLDGNQNDLVTAVAAANRRTIVVLNTGGPVTMPWLGDVGAVVEAWYPGQEDGHALAAVLTGDVNPSAKLPVTFPTGLGQDPAHDPPRYPARHGAYQYAERLEVGYRWYDAHSLTPLFPFGYGLSYTTFSLARLSVSPAAGPPDGVKVSFEVTNTGRRPGTETPQIYVGFPPSIGEPPHRLAAFAKVTLAPGETRQVTAKLPPTAFSFWDIEGHRFATAAGDHTIAVGTSARHLPLSASVHLADTR